MDKIEAMIFPVENIHYLSQLETSEIIRRLNENVEPVKFRFSLIRKDTKLFEGEVYEDRFNIRKVMRRNPFNPVMKGRIKETSKGNFIEIHMHLYWSAYLILFIFNSYALMFFILVFFQEKFIWKELIFPINIFFINYFMMLLGFKSVSSDTKYFFKHLFEGEIIKE